MSVAVRTYSLTLGGNDQKSIAGMTAHGMRLDSTSQKRRVRDVSPLLWKSNSLDLRAAYDEHVEGCRMNKALKRPVLHSIVQFPKSLHVNDHNHKAMLQMAVEFINQSHGGDAVFSARLDRDEKGQHTVDVFYSPKYVKTTKSKGDELWISTTRHGKELCHKHRDEIERRSKTFNTSPRSVGMSINSEFRNFMMSKGFKIDAKKEKAAGASDRSEPQSVQLKDAMKKIDILRTTIVTLHEQLVNVSDLIPTKTWSLLSQASAIFRKQGYVPKKARRKKDRLRTSGYEHSKNAKIAAPSPAVKDDGSRLGGLKM